MNSAKKRLTEYEAIYNLRVRYSDGTDVILSRHCTAQVTHRVIGLGMLGAYCSHIIAITRVPANIGK